MLSLSCIENDHQTGEILFEAHPLLERLAAEPVTVCINSNYDHARFEVERFIKDIYAKSYGARIHVHYPILMSMHDKSGRIIAAVGFRPAVHEPLFLEQYLKSNVENVLQAPRRQIVEIGNLASDGGGASVYLFAVITAYLSHQGFTHAVVTGTNFLEKRFKQLGLKPKRQAKADPNLLLHVGEDWGTYYNTQPHVLSGSLADSYRRLKQFLGVQYISDQPTMLAQLHGRGKGASDAR